MRKAGTKSALTASSYYQWFSTVAKDTIRVSWYAVIISSTHIHLSGRPHHFRILRFWPSGLFQEIGGYRDSLPCAICPSPFREERATTSVRSGARMSLPTSVCSEQVPLPGACMMEGSTGEARPQYQRRLLTLTLAT